MDKQIELDVLVDGDELKYHGPHPESKRTYVVVNLEARTSYPKHIVEQTPWGPEPRDDPVTPYSIRVTNRSGKVCAARCIHALHCSCALRSERPQPALRVLTPMAVFPRLLSARSIAGWRFL